MLLRWEERWGFGQEDREYGIYNYKQKVMSGEINRVEIYKMLIENLDYNGVDIKQLVADAKVVEDGIRDLNSFNDGIGLLEEEERLRGGMRWEVPLEFYSGDMVDLDFGNGIYIGGCEVIDRFRDSFRLRVPCEFGNIRMDGVPKSVLVETKCF